MTRPEGLIGVEALRTYSFRDVTVSPGVARSLLTERTRATVNSNFDLLKSRARTENPGMVAIYETERGQTLRSLQPGGRSLSERKLQYLYTDIGHFPYATITDSVTDGLMPMITRPRAVTEKDAGVEALGYYLDLLDVLDPSIATQRDGTQVILDSLRKSRISMEFLGSMIDDTIHLRSMQAGIADILADREGAERFRDTVLELATPDEREEIIRGIETPLSEYQMRSFGQKPDAN